MATQTPPHLPPLVIAAPPPPSSERRTPLRPCLNCGDTTVGNFCPVCGQRKVEVRVSLRRMVLEVLDDQFSISSALPRTIGALLFRPGQLTREYMGGRIARYIPPFRLYLASSVVFFLVLSSVPRLEPTVYTHGSGIQIGVSDPEAGEQAARAARGGPAAPVVPTPSGTVRTTGGALRPPPPVPPGGGWGKDMKVQTGIAELDSLGNERLDRLRMLPPQMAVRQVLKDFMEHAPQMMFVLLPVFAGVLKLLYLRSRRFYVEHFVFSLHLHAFAYLHYLLMMAVAGLGAPAGAVALLGMWPLIYVYAALKRVYAQGWLVTGAKYVTLGLTWVTLLAVATVVTLLVTVFLL